MQFLSNDCSMRKTLASYERIGVRRMAKTGPGGKRNSKYYLDLTNLWRTNSQEQNKQYQAIKNSDLFSEKRSATFLKFNYRNYQPGTYGYESAFLKIKKKGGCPQLKQKGTMQVSDLWGDEQMQKVMGSPAFPRDRLKILRVWGRPQQPSLKTTHNKRVSTVP